MALSHAVVDNAEIHSRAWIYFNLYFRSTTLDMGQTNSSKYMVILHVSPYLYCTQAHRISMQNKWMFTLMFDYHRSSTQEFVWKYITHKHTWQAISIHTTYKCASIQSSYVSHQAWTVWKYLHALFAAQFRFLFMEVTHLNVVPLLSGAESRLVSPAN